MLGWIVVGSCVVGFLAQAILTSRHNARELARQRRIFQTRPRSDVGAWYQQFFTNAGLSQDNTVNLLQPIADAMQCQISQLRPDDSFTGTLCFQGWSWFGVGDDDPLSDYAEYDLVRVLGNEQQVKKVIELVGQDPTLLSLMCAVAQTDPTGENH